MREELGRAEQSWDKTPKNTAHQTLEAVLTESLERFLGQCNLAVFTAKTIRTAERLRSEIAEVRRSGVGFDDGEASEELRCAAVPVADFSGRVIASLGISGPSWRLSIQALHKNATILQRAAERLSLELGAGRAERTS